MSMPSLLHSCCRICPLSGAEKPYLWCQFYMNDVELIPKIWLLSSIFSVLFYLIISEMGKITPRRIPSTGRAQIKQGAVVQVKAGPVIAPPGTQPSSSSSFSRATYSTRSTNRAYIRGVVLHSSFRCHWTIYWFAFKKNLAFTRGICIL